MDQLPQALLFLGIIPALILIFISLKGYEEYFKFKIVFITLVIGMIIGFITIFIETYTYTDTAGLLFIILIIFLYPILEQLFKTIFLNLKRFHGKKETTIYGLSLGLGFGSIFILSSLIQLYMRGSVNTFSLTLTILVSLGFMLIHAATGLYIGFGVYSYSLVKYLLLSIFLYILAYLWFYSIIIIERGYLHLAIFPYGILLYWHATTKIMPRILKDDNTTRKRKK